MGFAVCLTGFRAVDHADECLPGETYQDEAPVWAPDPWLDVRANAAAALRESDLTVLRCYEASVPVPTEWSTYRHDLRAIVRASTGDATAPLPARPAYPAGT